MKRKKLRVSSENNIFCYPTALRRVQIKPKMSTNIMRYLYSRGLVRQVFSQHSSDELDIEVTKKKFVQQIKFLFCVFTRRKS